MTHSCSFDTTFTNWIDFIFWFVGNQYVKLQWKQLIWKARRIVLSMKLLAADSKSWDESIHFHSKRWGLFTTTVLRPLGLIDPSCNEAMDIFWVLTHSQCASLSNVNGFNLNSSIGLLCIFGWNRILIEWLSFKCSSKIRMNDEIIEKFHYFLAHSLMQPKKLSRTFLSDSLAWLKSFSSLLYPLFIGALTNNILHLFHFCSTTLHNENSVHYIRLRVVFFFCWPDSQHSI
jgi:hypothetical protein